MVDLNKIRAVRQKLTRFFKQAVKVFGTEEIVNDIMVYRDYANNPEVFDMMKTTLMEIGIFKIESLSDFRIFYPNEYTMDDFEDFGLVNSEGRFILRGLYVVPIKDINGDIVGLVGWNPQGGARKYVTATTVGYSRDNTFFNFDHAYKLAWEKFEGKTFMVEGIFDTLVMRALGLPCIGVQGLELSSIKSRMLARFSKVIAVPDNDNSGRSVNPYLNELTEKGSRFVWHVKTESVFIILPLGIKDCDDYFKYYDCREQLLACMNFKYMKRIREDDEEEVSMTKLIAELKRMKESEDQGVQLINDDYAY